MNISLHIRIAPIRVVTTHPASFFVKTSTPTAGEDQHVHGRHSRGFLRWCWCPFSFMNSREKVQQYCTAKLYTVSVKRIQPKLQSHSVSFQGHSCTFEQTPPPVSVRSSRRPCPLVFLLLHHSMIHKTAAFRLPFSPQQASNPSLALRSHARPLTVPRRPGCGPVRARLRGATGADHRSDADLRSAQSNCCVAHHVRAQGSGGRHSGRGSWLPLDAGGAPGEG